MTTPPPSPPLQPMEFLDVNTVALEPGLNLIEASAGTGKTYSITALYLRFLLEEELQIQQILSVTYTVAATQELRDRIRTRLRNALDQLQRDTEPNDADADAIVCRYLAAGGQRKKALRILNLAIQTFDEAPIFTIHGFCHRMLLDYAFESGIRYSAETLQSSSDLYREIAEDFWRRQFYRTNPFLAALALTREAANLSPKSLAQLLGLRSSHPGLIILPAAPPQPLLALGEESAALLGPLYELWCQHHEEIAALALDEKCLKKPFLDSARTALAVLEHALTSFDGPTPPLIDAFCALSKTHMMEQLRAKKSAPEHPFFDLCETFERHISNYLQKLPHEFLDYAERELHRRKEARNLLSFDDLLVHLHRALQPASDGAPSPLAHLLSARYRVALIDEFQDTDQLQTEIFTRVFAPTAGAPTRWLYYIGDPKQAIYAFRGADIFSYLQAASSATRRYSLQTNYRSCPKLLQGFNHFFTCVERPFLFEKIAYIPVTPPAGKEPGPEPPFIFRRFQSEKELSAENAASLVAAMVARDILLLHHRKHPTPSWRFKEMAVLVRTGDQAQLVQEQLRHHGIPSVLHSDKSVFHTDEAAALEKLLRSLVNPRNATLLRTALLTPLFALSPEQLHALPTDEAALEHYTTLFNEWKATWDQHGFVAFYRRFLTAVNLREQAILQPGGERFLTNLTHLSELLHREEVARQLSAEALADWLHAQRMNEQSSSDDSAQLRLESDSEAVTIVTIHKSKGLEYAVVFCPFLWGARDFSRRPPGCFHNDAGEITLDRRSNKEAPPEHVERYRFETRAEEMRLLYVALTRAKHLCYLYFGNARSFKDSALGHLYPEGEEQLANFASQHRGLTLLVEGELPLPPPAPIEAPPAEHLQCRSFQGTLFQPPFLTSFTTLARDHAASSRSAAQLTEPRELRKLDEPAPDSPLALPTTEEDEAPSGIFLFDKGMHAGDFFHDVLEHLDFQNLDELEELLPLALARHGFAETPHREALDTQFRAIVQTELQPSLRLNQIAKSARLAEVEFSLHLPELTSAQLRTAYGDYHGPLDVAGLNFTTVRGFLRGVIDLFFEHEGRYYILDWKSNWLGNTPAAYSRANVDNAMRQHHYALQAHLYLLACDRFLQNRIKSYSYEQHFGGILYLFLRGITPSQPELGVFFERPDSEFVERLRALQTAPKPQR